MCLILISTLLALLYLSCIVGKIIKIPPSKNRDGSGVRIGSIKRSIAAEARRRLYYNSSAGDPVFNTSSKLFISGRAEAAEFIYPTTESFWMRTNKQKKRKRTNR